LLQPGDSAPLDIPLFNEANQPITLKELLGLYVVLYFYPKDNTPGCTIEACEFRDFGKDISAFGVTIYGVSKDSVDSHNKFKTKHQLNFSLLSDPDGKLLEAFGVFKRKSMFGKTFMGIQRSTFIIDPRGKIIKVWENVVPKGHAQEVYNYLKTKMANLKSGN